MRRTQTRIRNQSRLPLFSFESLEDRCVFSVSTLDLSSVAGVRTFADSPEYLFALSSDVGQFTYSGNFLSVPSDDTVGRIALFDFADTTVPGTITTSNEGRALIGATQVLDVPESQDVNVRLTSTTTPGDSIQYLVRVETSFAASMDSSYLAPSILIETTPLAVIRRSQSPPPASPPPAPVTRPSVGGSTTSAQPPGPIPQPNPTGIPAPVPPPGPEEKPQPTPSSPARESVTVSPVEFSPIVAGATQAAFVAAQNTPRLPTVPTTTLTPISASGPSTLTAAPGPWEDEPIVLELVATREAATTSPKLDPDELPTALLGTPVEVQAQPTLSLETKKILTRLAFSEELPASYVATEVAPIEVTKPDSESGRFSYLSLTVLVGLGTGHYFGWGQGVPNNRRGSDRRPSREELPAGNL